MAIEKLKRPCIDQIPSELIKEVEREIRSEIHKFITYIWNKEELPEEWKESIIVPIYKKDDSTDCSNYRGIPLIGLDWTRSKCCSHKVHGHGEIRMKDEVTIYRLIIFPVKGGNITNIWK
jgi:hypothetical protein